MNQKKQETREDHQRPMAQRQQAAEWQLVNGGKNGEDLCPEMDHRERPRMMYVYSRLKSKLPNNYTKNFLNF